MARKKKPRYLVPKNKNIFPFTKDPISVRNHWEVLYIPCLIGVFAIFAKGKVLIFHIKEHMRCLNKISSDLQLLNIRGILVITLNFLT